MTDEILWQFDLAWALADLHYSALVEEDVLWSTAIVTLAGAAPRDRADVTWPGDGGAAVTRLRELASTWREVLASADLAGPSSFPWRGDAGRRVAHTALWVNVELTKNISEIGQLRLTRR